MIISLKNYTLFCLFDSFISYSKNSISYSYYNSVLGSNFFSIANSLFVAFRSIILHKFQYFFSTFNFKLYKTFFTPSVDFHKYFKFLTFVGLGFKKRMRRLKKHIYLFFGHRHWIIFKIPLYFSIYLIKRKSIIMYSETKSKMSEFLSSFKNFKKESMFKIKGLFDMRSRKRWLFMRRIKVRGVRPKLSKKQKLL